MQDEDFTWFIENYNELFEKYGVSYLAIRNKTVLGSYHNFKNAIDETKKDFPLGQFIVQYCNGEESGYTNYVTS